MKKYLVPVLCLVVAVALAGIYWFLAYPASQQVSQNDTSVEKLSRLERIKKIEEIKRNAVSESGTEEGDDIAVDDTWAYETTIDGNDQTPTTNTVQLGSDTLQLSLKLPSQLKLTTYQGEEDGDWVQFFITDGKDDLLSFYIEKPLGDDGFSHCHFGFCFLELQKTVATQMRSWEYLGDASYGDAGFVMTFPFVYKSVEGEYMVYLESDFEVHALEKNTDLGMVFDSVDFTITSTTN